MQGCPLSPFLYILVADSLSRRLNILLEEGKIPGLSFKAGIQTINHALFADNSILLVWASTQIARSFQQSLNLFLLSSGARRIWINAKFTGGTIISSLSEISPKFSTLNSITIGHTSTTLVYQSLKIFLFSHVDTGNTKNKKTNSFSRHALAQYCRENHSHPVNSVRLPHLHQLNDSCPQVDHEQ